MTTPAPEDTSSRDDLAAAVAGLEAATNNAGDPPPPTSLTGDAPPRSAGEGGQSPAPATPPAEPKSGQPGAAAAAPAGAPSAPPAPEVRPPASWRPEMHAHWKTIPGPAQQEILRREREIGGLQQGSAQARDFMQQFQQVAQPYQQFFAMYGNGNPLEGFRDYLQTVSLLRQGSPQDKAARLAMAVHEFGVDINLLDGMLAQIARTGRLNVPGGQPQGGQPQGGQQQFRDPRVDAILEQQESALQESVTAELETFAADPKNEYYEQVRNAMADLLDFEANRGNKLTLKQAYDRACKMDDAVVAAMEKKKTQTQQLAGARAVQAARAAATPGAGGAAPASAGLSKGSGSMSDDIKASIDKLSEAA